MNKKFFEGLLFLSFAVGWVLAPSTSSARFTMAADYDGICSELPTPGDHLGSECRCKGVADVVASASCRRVTWDGVSMCTGYELGTPCSGGGVNPLDDVYELKIPVEIQDSVFVDLYEIEGGDTSSPHDYSAAYEFHHLYDSTRVVYTFAELWQSTERLELANWNFEVYEKDKTAAELSTLSRSKSFTITGDTISYYREISWFDHRPGHRVQLANNFYCTDTLTYVVSFVNEVTQQRIEVQRLTVTGDGNGHIMTGGGLPMAVVRWVPPTSWEGVSAYVDLELAVEGSGLFNPAKWGSIVGNISHSLKEPFYSGYYQQFNQPYQIGGTIE